LVALVIGEWQNIRSIAYYTFAGLAISMAGFIAQFSSEVTGYPTIMNWYAFLTFALSGLVAGFVYWLAAGQKAGDEVPLMLGTEGDIDLQTENENTAASARSSIKDMLAAADKTSVPVTGPNGPPRKTVARGP
jgi:hypothetical protein